MGVITLEPTRIERMDEGCFVQWDSVDLRMEEPPLPGPITGRLYLDAHTDFGDIDPVEGQVEGIEIVPLRYREKSERYFVPAEQLDAIPANSTLERERVSTKLDDRNGSITPELLIWLKID